MKNKSTLRHLAMITANFNFHWLRLLNLSVTQRQQYLMTSVGRATMILVIGIARLSINIILW